MKNIAFILVCLILGGCGRIDRWWACIHGQNPWDSRILY